MEGSTQVSFFFFALRFGNWISVNSCTFVKNHIRFLTRFALL